MLYIEPFILVGAKMVMTAFDGGWAFEILWTSFIFLKPLRTFEMPQITQHQAYWMQFIKGAACLCATLLELISQLISLSAHLRAALYVMCYDALLMLLMHNLR